MEDEISERLRPVTSIRSSIERRVTPSLMSESLSEKSGGTTLGIAWDSRAGLKDEAVW
jgi:hypothetical protein